jgi:hypothetical protein
MPNVFRINKFQVEIFLLHMMYCIVGENLYFSLYTIICVASVMSSGKLL